MKREGYVGINVVRRMNIDDEVLDEHMSGMDEP